MGGSAFTEEEQAKDIEDRLAANKQIAIFNGILYAITDKQSERYGEIEKELGRRLTLKEVEEMLRE